MANKMLRQKDNTLHSPFQNHRNMHKKPTLAIIVGLIALCTSCVTPQKIEATVKQHYNNELPKIRYDEKALPFSISHAIQDTAYGAKMTSVRKVPARNLITFFYNHYHAEVFTTLHPNIAIHQLTNSLAQYAKSGRVAERLKDQSVIIHIEEIPRVIQNVEDSKNYLFLLTFNRFYMQPGTETFKARYTIQQAGTTVKEGTIEIPNKMERYNQPMLEAWQVSMKEVLTNYDGFLKGLGKQVWEKILADK